MHVINSSIYNNTAVYEIGGGGVLIEGGQSIFTNSHIDQNEAHCVRACAH